MEEKVNGSEEISPLDGHVKLFEEEIERMKSKLHRDIKLEGILIWFPERVADILRKLLRTN